MTTSFTTRLSLQVLVSEQYSDPSSSVMQETHRLNNNCSHMPSWVSPCLKPWDFSVLWWRSYCCLLFKFFISIISSITHSNSVVEMKTVSLNLILSSKVHLKVQRNEKSLHNTIKELKFSKNFKHLCGAKNAISMNNNHIVDWDSKWSIQMGIKTKLKNDSEKRKSADVLLSSNVIHDLLVAFWVEFRLQWCTMNVCSTECFDAEQMGGFRIINWNTLAFRVVVVELELYWNVFDESTSLIPSHWIVKCCEKLQLWT